MISYTSSDKFDDIYSDEKIIASRVHLGILGEKNTPFQKSGIYSWIEGEIYNLNEIVKLFKYKSKTFSELLIDAYIDNNLETVLSKIDGIYSAILYDKKKLKFISDRYGMKPLYIWNNNDCFAWVSELKALLPFKAFIPIINIQAIKCFMDLGHLIGEITWFKDVKLMNASSVITYSLEKRKVVEEKRYWKWSSIKPQNITFNEAVIQLGKLLERAVRKRVNIDKKLGVSISGGLDSRLNLAIIDQIEDLNVVYYTFGKKDCDDIRIAKLVSQIKNNIHYIFELNKDNWLDNRFKFVWYTDGLVSLLHLHNPLPQEQFRKLCDINIDGFVGDIIMGGSWIGNLNKRIEKGAAIKRFGNQIRFTDLKSSFFNINREGPYFIDTRARRFTNIGQLAISRIIETRKPFLDNDLIEFIYSLPDEYRLHSKLYNKTLLYKHPEYYKKIPWQKTGLAISEKMTLHGKILEIIKTLLEKFSIIESKKNYADYGNWLRTHKIIKLTKKILNPENALYSKYIDINFIVKYLNPIIKNSSLIYRCLNMQKFIFFAIREYFLDLLRDSKKSFLIILKKLFNDYNYNTSKKICRALTIEIWLQQVFNNKYRD